MLVRQAYSVIFFSSFIPFYFYEMCAGRYRGTPISTMAVWGPGRPAEIPRQPLPSRDKGPLQKKRQHVDWCNGEGFLSEIGEVRRWPAQIAEEPQVLHASAVAYATPAKPPNLLAATNLTRLDKEANWWFNVLGSTTFYCTGLPMHQAWSVLFQTTSKRPWTSNNASGAVDNWPWCAACLRPFSLDGQIIST